MIGKIEIDNLRADVAKVLSAKRFSHSIGVERAALEIGKHCLPYKLYELSAAALLHDIAKEMTKEEQLLIMKECERELSAEDFTSEALYHAFCAPAVIKKRFPEFATDEILSAVFLHTSGGSSMSLFDEIIFVADFVEDTRSYDACKAERKKLFENLSAAETIEEKIQILHTSTVSIIDFTLKYLEAKGMTVNSRMLMAKRTVLNKISYSG